MTDIEPEGLVETSKIIKVVEEYERRLRELGVKKIRMDLNKTFKDLTEEELLSHAYFLCDGVKELAYNPEKRRKTGSHLTAIQMCLSFAGWYTLAELMDHSKPD